MSNRAAWLADRLAAGLAASSLVVFLFIVNEDFQRQLYGRLAAECFVAAMPPLVGAYLLSQKGGLNLDRINQGRLETIAVALFFLGALLYMIGITLTMMAVDRGWGATFGIATGITLFLVNEAIKERRE